MSRRSTSLATTLEGEIVAAQSPKSSAPVHELDCLSIVISAENVASLAAMSLDESESAISGYAAGLGLTADQCHRVREAVHQAREIEGRRASPKEHRRDDDGWKPTHDELARRWLGRRRRNTIFSAARWYRYTTGVWSEIDAKIIDREVWLVMIAAKPRGFRPTKSAKASIVDCIQSEVAVPTDMLDRNPALINLENGTFDLESMSLRSHDPRDYLTTQLPLSYDPNAKAERWNQALGEWLEHQDDAIRFVQEAVGLSLTADMRQQKAFILTGEGENGKDTFLNLLRTLGGSAYYELDLTQLAQKQWSLANLVGKRVVVCAEAMGDETVAHSYVKRLISGEGMEVQAKYGRPFVMRPLGKIWWAVNELPSVNDPTHGYWRRWTVIPFNVRFTDQPKGNERPKDRDLGAKLLAELPGLFNWAMEGYARLQVQGHFTEVPAFEEALADYREANDITALFVAEECDTGEEYADEPMTLYEAYKQYCNDRGTRPKGLRRFGTDLKRLGYQSTKSNGRRLYRGVKVRVAFALPVPVGVEQGR